MIPQRFVLRIRKDPAGPPVHVDEPFAIRHRQALEEGRVDQAEHRRVGADSQGQRQHGGDRESRLLAQHPDGVAQVVKESRGETALSWCVGQRRRHARLPQRAQAARELVLAVQFLERDSPRVVGRGAFGAQLLVAIVEVLRELLDDLGLARRAEPQRRQPGLQVAAPVGAQSGTVRGCFRHGRLR